MEEDPLLDVYLCFLFLDVSMGSPPRKEKKKKKVKEEPVENLGEIQKSQSFTVEPSEKKVRFFLVNSRLTYLSMQRSFGIFRRSWTHLNGPFF